MSNDNSQGSLLVPNVKPINWLSSQAYPNIDQTTRQISSFGDATSPGRVAWHSSTSTSDGLTTVQWYELVNQSLEPISLPENASTWNSATETANTDIVLEVALPQLSEFLELGGYVAPDQAGNVGNVNSTYYNTPVWFQFPLLDFVSVSVAAIKDSSADGYSFEGTVSWAPNSSEQGGNPEQNNSGTKTWQGSHLSTSNVEIDYQTKMLRLTFDAGSKWNDYYIGTYNGKDFLKSGSKLSTGPTMVSTDYTADVGFSTGFNETHASYTPDSSSEPFKYSPHSTWNTSLHNEANRVGVTYQSRSFEPVIKEGFRSANPDQTLYSTLDGTAWYLLADTTTPATTNNFIADSAASSVVNDIPAETPSSLITIAQTNQIQLSVAGDSKAEAQLARIEADQGGPLGLYFTRLGRNSAGDPQPVTQRVIGSYGQPGMSVSGATATIELEPIQMDFGARVTTQSDASAGKYSVTLDGMTISSPAAVISLGGAGSDSPVGPYAVAQIPVWLVEKVGYISPEGTVPPEKPWTIPVTLEYPPSQEFPNGLTLNAVLETVNAAPTPPVVVPTSLLEITISDSDSVTFQTSGTQGTQSLSSKEITDIYWSTLETQRPLVTVTDATFDDTAVTTALPTSEWVLWSPSFSSMQEAFSVLMSAYLKLYQGQLEMAGSVVQWYNSQIEAVNNSLNIVNAWGLGSNVHDNETYTYVTTFADRNPQDGSSAGVKVYGESLAAQFDWVAQTLSLYNVQLTNYVSVAWPDDPSKHHDGPIPSGATTYEDKEVPNASTFKRYIWGGANTGSDQFNNFTTAVKNVISNLTNVSQQQTTSFSNLNSQYTQGVTTLTQVLEKLNQSAAGIAAKL